MKPTIAILLYVLIATTFCNCKSEPRIKVLHVKEVTLIPEKPKVDTANLIIQLGFQRIEAGENAQMKDNLIYILYAKYEGDPTESNWRKVKRAEKDYYKAWHVYDSLTKVFRFLDSVYYKKKP